MATALPRGWLSGIAPVTGAPYYLNTKTGVPQVDPPIEVYVAPPSAPALPQGWTTGYEASTGKTYFTHPATGVAQYDSPTIHSFRAALPTAPVQQPTVPAYASAFLLSPIGVTPYSSPPPTAAPVQSTAPPATYTSLTPPVVYLHNPPYAFELERDYIPPRQEAPGPSSSTNAHFPPPPPPPSVHN